MGQALRPFPQFYNLGGQGFGTVYEPTGMSTYNSLQSTLVRQFRDGVHLQASYTWSKTLTDADSAIPFLGASGTSGNNPGAPIRTEKALSVQDIPQIFVVSYIYELPFGRDKRFSTTASFSTRWSADDRSAASSVIRPERLSTMPVPVASPGMTAGFASTSQETSAPSSVTSLISTPSMDRIDRWSAL